MQCHFAQLRNIPPIPVSMDGKYSEGEIRIHIRGVLTGYTRSTPIGCLYALINQAGRGKQQ
jgi:hypothetical protein